MTFWPISKQTADFQKKGFYANDQLLMLYVLASIVFLYHQWLRWDFEMLEETVRQGGVSGMSHAIRILCHMGLNFSVFKFFTKQINDKH